MNIINIDAASMINGDGVRLVIWFAGCSLNCDGCQNKDMQKFNSGKEVSPKKLASLVIEYLNDNKLVNGITLSGGNPQEQPDLLIFLKAIRKLMPQINIWAWSGYTWDKIQQTPTLKEHLDYIDTIITGPYIKALHCECEYYGSTNQEAWRKTEGTWKKD